MEETDESDIDNANLKFLTWAGYLEDLMAKWSDNALSYAWLHNKAEAKYRKLNYSFTIPIVILSTIVGTINVGINSLFPPNLIQLGNIIIGGLGLFTGILGTLQNFFKYAQLSEAHRNSAIQWHKFHRMLKTELALESVCRRNAGEFFRSSKAELDRLLDSSPYIPGDVVERYIQENTIELPDVIGNLQKTMVFRGGLRLSPKMSTSPKKTPEKDDNFIKISRDMDLTPNPLNRIPRTVTGLSGVPDELKDIVIKNVSTNLSNSIGNSIGNIKNTIEETLNLSDEEINRVKMIANMRNIDITNIGEGQKTNETLSMNQDEINKVVRNLKK